MMSNGPHYMLRALVTLPLLLLSLTCWSLDKEPFTEARFNELQEQGALILVDVHADWCPTCAQQQKVLAAYRAQRPQVALHILNIDFDADKKWVKAFKAPRQSTLLLYRGKEQVWFSVAETRANPIFEALDDAAAATP